MANKTEPEQGEAPVPATIEELDKIDGLTSEDKLFCLKTACTKDGAKKFAEHLKNRPKAQATTTTTSQATTETEPPSQTSEVKTTVIGLASREVTNGTRAAGQEHDESWPDLIERLRRDGYGGDKGPWDGAKALKFAGRKWPQLHATYLKDFNEQRGGSHPVHIVITKDDQRLLFGVGAQQTFDRGGHVWQ